MKAVASLVASFVTAMIVIAMIRVILKDDQQEVS